MVSDLSFLKTSLGLLWFAKLESLRVSGTAEPSQPFARRKASSYDPVATGSAVSLRRMPHSGR